MTLNKAPIHEANDDRLEVHPKQRQWEAITSVAVMAAAAMAVTWPLANALDRAMPLGSETGLTVPFFNLWTLEWNAHALAKGYVGYWNAPIFHPFERAFALSEPQPLTGLVYAGLMWLTGQFILSYNLILLVALTLNGLLAQRFFLKVGSSRTPALLGGLMTVFLAFVTNEHGVLQLIMVFPMFGVMGSLWDAMRRRHRFAGVRLGLWYAVSFYTCSYYALFMSPLLCLICGALLLGVTKRVRLFQRLLVSAGVVALVVFPFALIQSGVLDGFSRPGHTMAKTSAQVVDYLRLPSRAVGNGYVPWTGDFDSDGYDLYPGTFLVVFSILAVARERSRRKKVLVFLCLLLAVVSFVLSLAGNIAVYGWHPIAVLRDYWPGFSSVRNLFRFAIFVQIALLTMAVIGLQYAYRRPSLRHYLITLVLLGIVETAVPLERTWLIRQDRLRPAWAAALTDAPKGPVLLLPVSAGGRAKDFEAVVEAMLALLPHELPLVNGYSGHFPRTFLRRMKKIKKHGSSMLEQSVLESQARYIVADTTWLASTDHGPGSWEDAGGQVLFADENHTLLAFPAERMSVDREAGQPSTNE